MTKPSTDIPKEAKKTPPKKGREKKESQIPRWNVDCLCGKKLSGFRAEASHIFKCHHCDEQHFILPISTYPQPKRIRKKKKKKRHPDEPFGITVRRIAKQCGQTGTMLLQKSGQAARQGFRNAALAVWKELTPLRLTMVAIVLVASLGGYFAIQQQQQSRALQVLRDSVTAGEKAVESKDWPLATEQYQLAAEAIATLKRTDAFAAEVLQKNRELQAIEHMCSLSLSEIIKQVSQPNQTLDSLDTFLRVQVRGQWVIVETWLDPLSNPGTGTILQTVPVEESVVDLIWPEALLSSQGGSQGQVHVLIAGQFMDVVKSNSPTSNWEVLLDPETAFLWCHAETTEPLHFDLNSPWLPEDSLQSVLDRQRVIVLGVKP